MTFQKGNTWGKAGRPKGSTNRIGKIRDRILRVLERRIMREKDLDTVSTGDLIKFVGGIIPKDLTLAISKDPTFTYISNVPRPELPRPEIENKQGENVD